MLKLEKIISGGQTGADQAGLDAAKDCGYQTGGTAPGGWRIENYDGTTGSNPKLAEYGLVQHPSPSYPPRTKKNVKDSCGTAWFGHTESPGAKLTIETARRENKALIINPTAEALRDWLIVNQIRVLNVAGNRASKFNPTIYHDTYVTVATAIAREND